VFDEHPGGLGLARREEGKMDRADFRIKTFENILEHPRTFEKDG
jgi:hypothetical protein